NTIHADTSTPAIYHNTLNDTLALHDALPICSMEILDQSLKALESTASMRQAGRTMKDTLDQELNRFDTENRFLFMDPSDEKVSLDRKSTRLNSSHVSISYAVFCLKKKRKQNK